LVGSGNAQDSPPAQVKMMAEMRARRLLIASR
jgi:hypothetical protein